MNSESLVRRLATRSAFISIIICWLLSPAANAQAPPASTLNSLSPNTAAAGGAKFTLTVNCITSTARSRTSGVRNWG